jgi:2-amino-4-hydroxy-6-hydroxymethyldihydropteridine diphosphokinase
MNEVVIAIGSNTGDREKYIREAIDILGSSILELKVSPIYETKAEGMAAGHEMDFLNCVGIGKTTLDPFEMLEFLLETEKKSGRERKLSEGYLSRSLDLDILLFNDEIIQSEILSVPHPRLTERIFNLKPMMDLVPSMMIPGTGKSVADFYLSLAGKENLVQYDFSL